MGLGLSVAIAVLIWVATAGTYVAWPLVWRRTRRQLPWAPTVDESALVGTPDPVQQVLRHVHAATMAVFEGWNRRLGSQLARRSLRESIDMRGALDDLRRARQELDALVRPLLHGDDALDRIEAAAEAAYARRAMTEFGAGGAGKQTWTATWTRDEARIGDLQGALARLAGGLERASLALKEPAVLDRSRIPPETAALVRRVADGQDATRGMLADAMRDWTAETSWHDQLTELLGALHALCADRSGLFESIESSPETVTRTAVGAMPVVDGGGVCAVEQLGRECARIRAQAAELDGRLRRLDDLVDELEVALRAPGSDQALLQLAGSLYRHAMPTSRLPLPELHGRSLDPQHYLESRLWVGLVLGMVTGGGWLGLALVLGALG